MKTVTLIGVVLTVALFFCGIQIGLSKRNVEIQDLNRQLAELRLNCDNKEMVEVLDQLLSPLTMDELRAMAEKLKQQKLRLIKKQSKEKSSNEN